VRKRGKTEVGVTARRRDFEGGNLGKFLRGKTSSASKELCEFGLFASSQTIFLCFSPEYNI